MRDDVLAPPFAVMGATTNTKHRTQQPVESSSDRDSVERLDDEASLVLRAGTGDGAAFGDLYDRYCRVIYAYLYSRTGDRALAEDLTSQTFFQALQAIGRYEQRGLAFSHWLYRIAANVLVSHARRPTPHVPVDEALHLRESSPGPEDAFLRVERALRLRTALATLAPDQQEAITLRFTRELRIKEIATEMRRSEGAVKMLLLRGMEALRHRLGDESESAADDGTV